MKFSALTAAAFGAALIPFAANANEPILEKGDFFVRLRALAVVPIADAEIEGIGGGVDISNEAVPEVDFGYFFTDNIAVELIAATARHTVVASDTALGNLDLGSVRHVPPTLTLQYHFQGLGAVKPYIGAGVNYTFFTEMDAEGFNVDYDDTFGWAVQAGADIRLTDRVFANIDLKYLDLDPEVDVTTTLEGVRTTVRADVEIDPILLGFGIGVSF